MDNLTVSLNQKDFQVLVNGIIQIYKRNIINPENINNNFDIDNYDFLIERLYRSKSPELDANEVQNELFLFESVRNHSYCSKDPFVSSELQTYAFTDNKESCH